MVALLPECVVSYISPLHTHAQSLSFFIYQYPACVVAHPEYAMKAAGSLVPTHFHNAVYTGGEGEGQAREESFSSLLSSFFSLRERCCPCQGGGRQERRKWLPFSLQLEPIVCSSHYLSLLLPLCVLTNLKQKNTLVHVLLDANSVVSRLKFFFHSLQLMQAFLDFHVLPLLLPSKARNRDVDNSTRHTKLTLILLGLLACQLSSACILNRSQYADQGIQSLASRFSSIELQL